MPPSLADILAARGNRTVPYAQQNPNDVLLDRYGTGQEMGYLGLPVQFGYDIAKSLAPGALNMFGSEQAPDATTSPAWQLAHYKALLAGARGAPSPAPPGYKPAQWQPPTPYRPQGPQQAGSQGFPLPPSSARSPSSPSQFNAGPSTPSDWGRINDQAEGQFSTNLNINAQAPNNSLADVNATRLQLGLPPISQAEYNATSGSSSSPAPGSAAGRAQRSAGMGPNNNNGFDAQASRDNYYNQLLADVFGDEEQGGLKTGRRDNNLANREGRRADRQSRQQQQAAAGQQVTATGYAGNPGPGRFNQGNVPLPPNLQLNRGYAPMTGRPTPVGPGGGTRTTQPTGRVGPTPNLDITAPFRIPRMNIDGNVGIGGQQAGMLRPLPNVGSGRPRPSSTRGGF